MRHAAVARRRVASRGDVGIPDQFIVRTSVGERFNTGGLVSGSQTVSIPINNEPLVFVSVRAPQSGTAWNFSLGCLQ